jgi:hypothetical protein
MAYGTVVIPKATERISLPRLLVSIRRVLTSGFAGNGPINSEALWRA